MLIQLVVSGTTWTSHPASTLGMEMKVPAKISGIMPAILTIKGRLARTGIAWRKPIRRPGYITGMLRRPCWTMMIMNMTATITTM